MATYEAPPPELLSWFRLGKYRDADKLTAKQWLEHLLLRRYLWHEVLSLQPWRTDHGPKDTRDVLAILHDNPILDISSNKVARDYLYKVGASALDSHSQSFMPGVRLATVADLYRSEGLCLDDEERAEARGYFDWSFHHRKSAVKFTYQPWFDRAVDRVEDHVGGEILVRIDMLMPDTMLIGQFKQLLKSMRPPMASAEVVFPFKTRQPNFKYWIKSRVLPCLDVELWGRSRGIDVTSGMLLEAVFPQGKNTDEKTKTDENIRKTYHPIAKSAISWENLTALHAIVKQEQANGS